MAARHFLSGAILLTCAVSLRAQAPSTETIVKRLSAEADRFAEIAPRVTGIETLRQTVAGAVSHEVISEYGFIPLPTGMHEVRRVLTVDGHKVKRSKRLDSLALVIASHDDEDRLRLLQDFEKHGLQGVASDFGLLLLLFAHANSMKFEFSTPQRLVINNEPVLQVRFQQIDGAESLTIFEEGKPVKEKLQGEIWARLSDGMPLRVILDSSHKDGNEQIRDVGAVDYLPNSSGILLPVRVLHRQFRDRALHVEDSFRYAEFREASSQPSQ